MARPPLQRFALPALMARAGTARLVDLAAATGISRKTLTSARRDGGLTFWVADRAACALNLHPHEVWADWPLDSEDVYA